VQRNTNCSVVFVGYGGFEAQPPILELSSLHCAGTPFTLERHLRRRAYCCKTSLRETLAASRSGRLCVGSKWEGGGGRGREKLPEEKEIKEEKRGKTWFSTTWVCRVSGVVLARYSP
jgi:hypothetical protein